MISLTYIVFCSTEAIFFTLWFAMMIFLAQQKGRRWKLFYPLVIITWACTFVVNGFCLGTNMQGRFEKSSKTIAQPLDKTAPIGAK